MALYDNNGTTDAEIGKLYDNDGTTNYQTSKVYDNDGTTNRLIYSADEIFFENGVLLRPWDAEIASATACHVTNRGDYIELGAYNGNSAMCAWIVDVTGYNTLEMTASYNSATADGAFRFFAVPHYPQYPSNPRWNGSAYDGLESGNLGSSKYSASGTYTLDVSSLSGEIYVGISTTAGEKHYTNVKTTSFKLY